MVLQVSFKFLVHLKSDVPTEKRWAWLMGKGPQTLSAVLQREGLTLNHPALINVHASILVIPKFNSFPDLLPKKSDPNAISSE